MTSDSYQADATLGQASPLLSLDAPPYSTNYWLYPGFWYALEAGWLPDCAWDLEPVPQDGDVDGSQISPSLRMTLSKVSWQDL